MLPTADQPHVDVSSNATHVIATTSRLRVEASKTSGLATFTDLASGEVVEELGGAFVPSANEHSAGLYVVNRSWGTTESESMYGLGQFQNGYIDYNRAPVQLVQFNTEAIVPFVTSTRGYGLLLDHYSWSFWNPMHSGQVVKNGDNVTATRDGDAFLYYEIDGATWGSSNPNINIQLGQQTCQTWQSYRNHPNAMSCRIERLVQGGAYTLSVDSNVPITVFFRSADVSNTFEATAESNLDYYIVFPEQATPSASAMDDVIAQYRYLTGDAPLYGKWAYGFWQCKEHYATRDEVLQAAQGYRNRSIAVDNIVQDWYDSMCCLLSVFFLPLPSKLMLCL